MYSLSIEKRLKNADDFSSVFSFRRVKSGMYFRIHIKPNQLNHSRLGLIVGKKIHKRANKRNYMKRVIRELFRLNQALWLPHDIIVRSIKPFTNQDFLKICQEFLWLTSNLKQLNR